MVYSFIFTLSNRMDHVIRIINRYGSPDYSTTYLLLEKPISPPTRYNLTHLINDIINIGFNEPIVYEINIGNYIQSLLFVKDIIKNIEQDLFIILGSDNTLLDTLLLLSTITSGKEFQLIATHSINAIHLTDKTISILLGKAKIPTGALRILEYIRFNDDVYIKDIMNDLGYNIQTIKRYLYILKKFNLVMLKKGGKVKPTILAGAIDFPLTRHT